MNEQYELRILTPKENRCIAAACPSILEITPNENLCGVGACPAIYKNLKDDYLIIGEQVDPKEVGLQKKVGKGEVLLRIKKEIIDNKKII